jgi:IS605 OrfB family transposase
MDFDVNIANQITVPDFGFQYQDTKTHSWFNCKEFNHSNQFDFDIKDNSPSIDKSLRSRCITLFPNKKQKKVLLEWIRIYRYVYNLTLRHTKSIEYQNKELKKSDCNFRKLRTFIRDNFNVEVKKWIKRSKIPSHTIDNAISDVCKAYKTACANLRLGNIKHFRLRYKKEQSPRQTMVLEASAFSEDYANRFCKHSLGKYMKSSEEFKGVKHDSRLTYHTRLNRFVLAIPEDIEERKNIKDKIVSLDPGVRTFLTGYSNSKCIEIGSNGYDKVIPLIKKVKRLDNRRRTIVAPINMTRTERRLYVYKKFTKITKRYHRCNRKLKNIIDDMHWKSAKYLCENNKTIFLGKLSTKSIVSRTNNLPVIVKKILLRLRHYEFRNRLQAKCGQYGCNLYLVNEYCTTKTCCKCNNVKHNLGSNKTYSCNNCSIVIDRDLNGAINILNVGVGKARV